MLRRANERRVLPGSSPYRQPREELQPDIRTVAPQPRSPTQMFTPQVPLPQGIQFPHHRTMGDVSLFPGGVLAQPQQWYDATMDYGGDPEANAWATMELNTGAVAANGMEAYMIPVGCVRLNHFVFAANTIGQLRSATRVSSTNMVTSFDECLLFSGHCTLGCCKDLYVSFTRGSAVLLELAKIKWDIVLSNITTG